MATRRERVVLELQDDFSTGMARAAASAALLNRELDSLSKDSIRTQRSFSDVDRAATTLGRSGEHSGAQIDKLSGRLRVLADVATILTPALLPIGAVAVPALAGLSEQLGFAVLAGGTAVLAFQGIGDALKTMDKAALNPTRENLEAANLALQKLSPSARQFVTEIRSLIPEAQRLRDIAATGLFPGVVEGLSDLERALPRVQQIVASVSTELGHIAADTGASLASERWAPFLDFIAREAPQALGDMATAAGNTAHAVAELFMASEPLTDDFSQWLVDATADLDRWAAGLAKTQGFNEFVAFIEEHGPKVADTFGAIGSAVIQVVEAASPLSGPVLQGIEALANAVSAIADSDLGTPLFTAAAALALFNRTMAITSASRNGLDAFQSRIGLARSSALGFGTDLRTVRADMALLGSTSLKASATTVPALMRMNSASARLKANFATVGKGAAGIAALGIASTGAADGIGLTNTASLALLGTMVAPGWGTALGATAGLFLDAAHSGSEFAEALDRADNAILTSDIPKLSASLEELTRKQKAAQDSIGAPLPPRGQSRAFLEVEALGDKADEVKKKLDLTETAARSKANLDFLGQGFEATSTGLDTATQSAEDFKKSLDRINQVMSGRSTFRDYEQALLDFADRAKKRAEIQAKIAEGEAGVRAAQADVAAAKTPAEKESALKSLKTAKENVRALREELTKYKNTLDTTTQAGIDTQASIDAIATSAISYAKSIQDPALRTAFLDNARDQFIKASIDAGATKKAAKDMAREIGLLNGVKGKVTITVDANGAVHTISEVDRRLRKLERRLNRVQGAKNRDDFADIHDFAVGGWTGPGAKYDERGIVHADEFVFSKEATHGNVAYLEALHRQMRGYADGGLVRRASSAPNVSVSVASPASIDYERLAKAVAAVRPLAGVINVSGDGSFGREHKRLEALDGIGR